MVSHGGPGFWPVRALLGQRKVALGQLRAAGVDAVEDVHDYVDGLVLAGDRLFVEIAVQHLPEPGQPLHIGDDPRLSIRVSVQYADVVLQATGEQRGDVYPLRILAHLGWRVELERFFLDVEAQVGERLLVPLEEGRRPSPRDAVKRRDALLAVQDEHAQSRRYRSVP